MDDSRESRKRTKNAYHPPPRHWRDLHRKQRPKDPVALCCLFPVNLARAGTPAAGPDECGLRFRMEAAPHPFSSGARLPEPPDVNAPEGSA